VGVLSVAAAGRISINTYDPARILDPSNQASPFWFALTPGTPFRVSYAGVGVIRTAFLDRVTYAQAADAGVLEGSDGIALLTQAKFTVAQMAGAPTTLRALARWIIAAKSIPLTVEPDPTDQATGLPLPLSPVSPPPTSPATGWDWIVLAATDTLTAAWIDSAGVLRFRAYGDPRDMGLAIGGDPALTNGVPVADMVTTVSADGVWNRATCARPGGGAVADASDSQSIARFGERQVSRDRPAPDPDTWVASVIADRSNASLDWTPRTLRIRDTNDLAQLVGAGMVDMVRLNVDSAVPPMSALARLLGVSLRVTWADGWSGDVQAYVPSTDWHNDQVPPDPPINPTPPPTKQVVRTYVCIADARVSKTSGNANYGAGTAGQIPVGSWQGWQNRGLFKFAAIDWSDVVSVVSARVLFTTSSQVNVGFGSSPKSTVRRITANWSEGSLSSPGSGNSVIYPGPAVTSTGAVTEGVSGSQGARVDFACTAIARAGETNDAYTTEFLSRETGSSGSRPVLELTLNVLA
jgi:hypothetical protein